MKTDVGYVFDIAITVPARSRKEAEHFARLAQRSLDKRTAIYGTDLRPVGEVWLGVIQGDLSQREMPA